MKIICARLITGEEIIAKVSGPNALYGSDVMADPFAPGEVWDVPNGVVILEDVRIVALQQVPGRGVGISFIPYTMANPEGKVKLDLGKYAMSVFPPQADLERAYIGEHSGIALATPGTAAAAGIKLAS